ncbi:unnamed protein product, partial [Rotaria magnacalcarata]
MFRVASSTIKESEQRSIDDIEFDDEDNICDGEGIY